MHAFSIIKNNNALMCTRTSYNLSRSNEMHKLQLYYYELVQGKYFYRQVKVEFACSPSIVFFTYDSLFEFANLTFIRKQCQFLIPLLSTPTHHQPYLMLLSYISHSSLFSLCHRHVSSKLE